MTTRKGELSVKVLEWVAAGRDPRGRSPTSGTASPTPTPATASATSTCGSPTRPAPRCQLRSQARVADPALARGPRLHRGRDAGVPPHPRRRAGPAVHHAPQRARPGAVPAHRPRAVPEAARRRRLRAGVRDRPGVPQRGHLAPPQPRVHDARALPGLRRLDRHHGAHRAAGRATSPSSSPARTTHHLPGRRARPAAAVAAGHHGVADRGADRRRRRPRHPDRRAARAVRRARRAPGRTATAPGSSCSSSTRRPPSTPCGSPVFVTDYPIEVSPLARDRTARSRA